MIYRVFLAALFNFGVFPYVVMYTFALTYPDATFAFDRGTWLQGLAIVVFGWALFLSPGFVLPFVGDRYYSWVARVTGLQAVAAAVARAARRSRDRVRWLWHAGTAAVGRLRSPRRLLNVLRRERPADLDAVNNTATPAELPRAEPKRHPSAKDMTSRQLSKVRDVLKDTPRHIGAAKELFGTLRDKLTPDELQKRIDINQYTLLTFSHLKGLLRALLPSVDLEDADRDYCENVLNAVPEPPSPSSDGIDLVTSTFALPEARWRELKSMASTHKLALSDRDFELAAAGDLEKGLLIAKVLVLSALSASTQSTDPLVDDLMLGLPVTG